VLGEERGAIAGRSGRRWIIDPWMVRPNYAHGLPTFAVSIGLETAKRVELGVVFDRTSTSCSWLSAGRGAMVNDRRLTVSTTATLDESLLATGFPYDIRETKDNNLTEVCRVQRAGPRGPADGLRGAVPGVARHRSARRLLGAASGALGRRRRQPPRRGGGRPRDELGGGALDIDAPALVASNGRIHEAVLAVLQAIRGPT